MKDLACAKKEEQTLFLNEGHLDLNSISLVCINEHMLFSELRVKIAN